MEDLPFRAYAFGGMNRDVNPILMKDSDLGLALNFYTNKFGAKKVRFGYTQLLDQIDTSPVRNLIYYNMPSGNKGILRVSNSKIYKYTFSGSTWGSSVRSLGVDSVQGVTTLAGSVPYIHLSNATDGYYTWTGAAFAAWTISPSNNKPTFLASWKSRVFADVNKLSLAQSAVSFDLNSGYTTDPFTANANDPAGGGTASISAGKDGTIVGMTSSVDRINIYKQTGITRWNGIDFFQIPYYGGIFQNAIAPTQYNTDMFLATNGIFRNNGTTAEPASFGVDSVIRDTLRAHGITDPVGFSFNDLTIFYIGTIRIGTGDQALDVTNATLVHHEKYDEWYVWSLAHDMTCFSSYTDPTTNEPVLISGDANGNTYVWGEQYSSDDSKPINYRLRTKYWDFGIPETTKICERWVASFNTGAGAEVQFAADYSDNYQPQKDVEGFFKEGFMQNIDQFKTLSLQIQGSTTTDRPELLGITVFYKRLQERYNTTKNAARK